MSNATTANYMSTYTYTCEQAVIFTLKKQMLHACMTEIQKTLLEMREGEREKKSK